MIKKISTFIALVSLSNIASAHPEVLHSTSISEQVIHLITSPFHLTTLGATIVVLGFISYKIKAKRKLKQQKIHHTDNNRHT